MRKMILVTMKRARAHPGWQSLYSKVSNYFNFLDLLITKIAFAPSSDPVFFPFSPLPLVSSLPLSSLFFMPPDPLDNINYQQVFKDNWRTWPLLSIHLVISEDTRELVVEPSLDTLLESFLTISDDFVATLDALPNLDQHVRHLLHYHMTISTHLRPLLTQVPYRAS